MIKKLGKIGKINQIVRNINNKKLDERGINYCEVYQYLPDNYKNVHNNIFIGIAHRHNRDWYKTRFQFKEDHVKRLTDIKQICRACQGCHQFMDEQPEIRENVFVSLRGEE